MAKILRVGDVVAWRGAWGSQAPLLATVKGIDAVEPGEKYGREVTEMPWELVRRNYAVLTLANGHWCYGDQVEPMEVGRD